MRIPTHWQARAVCRDYDPEMFFPDPSDTVGQREAKAVCARCPVRVECLTEADRRHEQYGIWGGLERTDRGGAQRPRGRPPKNGHYAAHSARRSSPQAHQIDSTAPNIPTTAEAPL